MRDSTPSTFLIYNAEWWWSHCVRARARVCVCAELAAGHDIVRLLPHQIFRWLSIQYKQFIFSKTERKLNVLWWRFSFILQCFVMNGSYTLPDCVIAAIQKRWLSLATFPGIGESVLVVLCSSAVGCTKAIECFSRQHRVLFYTHAFIALLCLASTNSSSNVYRKVIMIRRLRLYFYLLKSILIRNAFWRKGVQDFTPIILDKLFSG